MPETMNEKAGRIHRKLWDMAQDNDGCVVHENDVEDVIKNVAGMSPRTIDNYKDALVDMGYVERSADKFTVVEPEGSSVEYNDDGGVKTKHLSAPRNLVEQAENLGLSLSGVFADALLERMRAKKQFVTDALDNDFSEAEVEFMWKLVSHDVYMVASDDDAEQDRQDVRDEIYSDVFGVDELSIEDYERLERLRSEAFVLGEKIL